MSEVAYKEDMIAPPEGMLVQPEIDYIKDKLGVTVELQYKERGGRVGRSMSMYGDDANFAAADELAWEIMKEKLGIETDVCTCKGFQSEKIKKTNQNK